MEGIGPENHGETVGDLLNGTPVFPAAGRRRLAAGRGRAAFAAAFALDLFNRAKSANPGPRSCLKAGSVRAFATRKWGDPEGGLNMRKILIAACAASLVLALLLPLSAQAGSPNDRATGGGQILVGTRGAGDTIAFTAQGTASEAKGQVQFIDRTGGIGAGQVKFHGVVDCILVVGNTAEIAGHERDSGDAFTLRVVDNGEGLAAADDTIFFDDTADDEPCVQDDNDDDDVAVALARGNAQVYDAPAE